jgi:hypothetical protein
VTARSWLGLGAALIALAVATHAAHADVGEDDDTASARRALIVLRILAYDKALATRAPGEAVVVFLLAGPSQASRAERDHWQAGFGLLPKVKAGGRPVRAMPVDYRDASAFEALVALHHPAAMIVTDGLGFAANALQRVARAEHVVAVSTREADVRGGFAIGLIAGDSRDEIVINLEAARDEGARFGAGLLQLARIMEGTQP